MGSATAARPIQGVYLTSTGLFPGSAQRIWRWRKFEYLIYAFRLAVPNLALCT